jgi:MSHA biogenesis protein MshK
MTPVHLCAIALTAISGMASAQNMTDPTRPPNEPAPSGAPAGPVGAAAAVSASPELQGILLSAQRRVAVIDGKTLRVGERLGDATLVALSETSATLKRGERLETLRLLPATVGKKARP